jgi:uncharacterized protein (DUF1501 family)
MNIFLRKTEDRSKPNRRDFLIHSTCASLGITSVVNTLAQLRLVGSAAASGASDYKALVCFFLNGGNDANNLLIPSETSGARTHYDEGRGILAIPDTAFDFSPAGAQAYFGQSGQVSSRITPQNSQDAYNPPSRPAGYTAGKFALHPLAYPMAQMFEAGDLAFVSNVGTLVGTQNVTRANFNTLPTAAKPPQLFSHSDQQVQWQSSLPDQPFSRGWGGKIADILGPVHGPGDLSLSVSLAGVNSFQVASNEPAYFMNSGGTVSPLSGFGTAYTDALRSTALQPHYGGAGSVPAGKYSPLAALSAGADPLIGTNYKHSAAGWRLRAIEQIMAMQHAALFDTEYLDSGTNARVTEGLVGNALAITATANGSTLDTHFTNWFPTGLFNPQIPDIASQMRVVARMIAGRSALSNTRQIFFVQLGGWDTHTSQTQGSSIQGHQGLVNQMARALRAFKDAMVSIGMWNNVLVFSASDFNRTFTANKSDATGGSDHAWGSHAWIAGGAVNGRRIFGKFPDLTVNGGIDCTGNRGRWIPNVATDQFYAPIAKWFGCTDQQIATILPNFTRFQPNLDNSTLANLNLNFINFS